MALAARVKRLEAVVHARLPTGPLVEWEGPDGERLRCRHGNIAPPMPADTKVVVFVAYDDPKQYSVCGVLCQCEAQRQQDAEGNRDDQHA